MRFTIVYDNDAMSGYQKSWGFACLVGSHILFDTGADLKTLLFNMNQMEIDLNKINRIVLSHEHGDHTGGIDIVDHLGEVRVFIPQSFSRGIKKKLAEKSNIEVVEVHGPQEIASGITSLGEIGSMKEQSIVVGTSRGLVVVTGCSHPGLHNILSIASQFGTLYGAIGGFHGFDKLEYLADLQLIVPCHCTRNKRQILTRYPNTSEPCGVGCVFDIP